MRCILRPDHVWIIANLLISLSIVYNENFMSCREGVISLVLLQTQGYPYYVLLSSRAALTEGDQLMSSPPIWLVSSWAHGRSNFPKKYLFSSPAIKK